MSARTALGAALVALVTLAACATSPKPQVRMGGEPIRTDQLTPAEVASQVTVTTRGADTVYRAPVLSSFRELDLQRGGPVVGANLGTVAAGRQGFLFGVRKGAAPVQDYVAFRSDYVEGTGRYVAVTLADGTSLPMRTTKGSQTRCEPDCLLVFETVVVEVPDAVLRTVPPTGLVIDYHLDNGTVTRATAPAAYVQGYLQAVDAARR